MEEDESCLHSKERTSEVSGGSQENPAESPQGLSDDELLPQVEVDEVAVHKSLMSKLVHVFLRRVELRGSDIRLDTGTLFRPDCCPRASMEALSCLQVEKE